MKCSVLLSPIVVVLGISVLLVRTESGPAQDPTSAQSQSATGHYEGAAKSKSQEAIPIVIDLYDAAGKLTGTVASPQGTYGIVTGSFQSGKISVDFDAYGERGNIAASLQDDKLAGTFMLGDESGLVQATRTRRTPAAYPHGKSPLARPILFLGTYHMDNPGLDAVNLQADDVLSSKRQAEIEALLERLVRFQPAVVAIEAPYRDSVWPDRYRKFLSGQYTLGRNEIEQIGFRLAKRLKLPTVHGIDYLMFMNGLTPSEMELRPPPNSGHQTSSKQSSALSAEDALLRRMTVTEFLRHLNSQQEIENNHRSYMNLLLPTSDSAIYSQADLVSNWYKRNLRIFANINRIAAHEKGAILVIIGAGHLKLLRDFAAEAPYFNLVDAQQYLEP